MGLLQISFAVTSITAAVFYYIARQRNESLLGSIDNPFTYVALLFGGLSLLLSFATVIRTKIETELNAKDIQRQAAFGRKEFLVTLVETYPDYIRRNNERLRTDINLLTAAQLSLILTISSTVASGLSYVNERSIGFYGILVVTFVAGGIFSIGSLWLVTSILAEDDVNPTDLNEYM